MAAHGCASLLLLHLRLAWRRSAVCMCPRLLAGSPALHALCTDSSVYERLCSARAAKGDSLHDLLAAGRAAVLLPPGQRLFASGNTFLDDIRCDCQRSNSRDRISTLALCTSTRGHRTTVHHCSHRHSAVLYRTLSQCLPSGMGASSGSGSDDRACVYMCVHIVSGGVKMLLSENGVVATLRLWRWRRGQPMAAASWQPPHGCIAAAHTAHAQGAACAWSARQACEVGALQGCGARSVCA